MEAPTKVFGPARIVALALIGLVALGLAYLQFKPASTPSPFLPERAPGSCSSTPATTRPQTAATPPTVGRSSCARTGTTPARA